MLEVSGNDGLKVAPMLKGVDYFMVLTWYPDWRHVWHKQKRLMFLHFDVLYTVISFSVMGLPSDIV